MSGLRPLVVGLYTSKWRPSARVTASMPESGLGSEVATNFDHDLPPSADQHSTIFDCWLLDRAWMRPSGCVSSVGWMASHFLSSSTGPTACQVWPRSVVRSKWTAPAAILEARRGDDRAVLERDRLVLDRAEETVGEAFGVRPRLAVVV